MTASRVVLYLCLAFIVGIFLNSLGVFAPHLFWIKGGGFILGILLISALWRHKKLVVVGFCLLFLVLGIWRHQAAMSEIFYPQEEEITFIGIVVQEPDVRETHTKLTLSEAKPPSIRGKILITADKYPDYQYGDKLRVAGKIQTPQEFPDFNYQDYLAKDGIYSVMYYPQIELMEREVFSFYGKILWFKDQLRESIYGNLSPPQSSILGAMILGDKRRMSDELKEKLNLAGVRHITAISGMHIMILAGILTSLGIWLGLRRMKAFYFVMSLLALYIIMVGLPASAVRAGIMGGLFLLARALGRQSDSARLIVFAAALMLFQNPLLLRWDIGFQLSFLAVIGMAYLMPEIKKWVKYDVPAMTLSAQIFTLPILIYNFGYFSPVGLITNILIVPLLAFVLGFGFIFGLAGIIWQPLGWILSWPSWLLLTYIVKIVEWFSQVPNVTI